MGSLSIWHWLIVLAVVLIVFGGSSKISTLMGDVAKGIKSFKKNMGEDESMEAGGRPPASPVAGPVGNIAPPPAGQSYGGSGYGQGAYAPGRETPPQQQAPVEPARHQG